MRSIRLHPAPEMVVPCGVFAPRGTLSKIASRASRLVGFKLAVFEQNLFLFHPSNASPDIPLLGIAVEYYTRHTPNIFVPVGQRLNVSDHVVPRVRQQLAQIHGARSHILIRPGAPISVWDLSEAVSVQSIDFGLLQ